MGIVIGVVVVVALLAAYALISPSSPSRAFRNRKDASAGWRDGANVGWFGDSDRRDPSDRPPPWDRT
ncbi:MAG: hypothetical protein QM747_11105 [Nocardioides sp.]